MEARRAFVVVCLCLFAGLGVSLAGTLEEDYVAKPGWLPFPPFQADTVRNQHNKWHGNEATFSSMVRGKEFLEFHREVLAQFDDFRIYGVYANNPAQPDPVVIPVVALAGSLVKGGRSGSPCTRVDGHPIDDGQHGACNKNSAYWTPRDGNLKLGTRTFHQYSANELGSNILPFHTNGHGAIGRHGPSDMISPSTSTSDPAFYQWHKNIDNVYADWAIGQYRFLGTMPLVNLSGMPILFSVSSDSVGVTGSALNARYLGNVYQGSTSNPVDEYGAKPRIGSDIYVGNNISFTGYSNLLYAAGTRVWSSPPDFGRAWDIDAWAILNSSPNSWYFSVTKSSAGSPDTAVDVEPDNEKGGDLFESCADTKNGILRPQDRLGLAATDELDALEFDRERRVQGTNDTSSTQIDDRPRQWFSLRSGTTYDVQAFDEATDVVMPVRPGDILRFKEDGVLVIEVRGVEDLDLAAGDDLDALALVDIDRDNALTAGDLIYYSLSAQSASVVAGTISAADIRCWPYGPVAGAWCPDLLGPVAVLASDLGLAANDDLDALDPRKDVCPLPAGLPAGPAGSPLSDPPTFHGACCGFSPSQACAEDKSQSECETAGGTFAGVDSVCATALCQSAPGACCSANGNCALVSDQVCYDSAGTFLGPGTTCPPTPACPVPPINDECVNAIVIPYNFVSGFQPPSDNTTATIPHYSLAKDPPYSCMDHNVFADARGSGTLWYSYTVPVISGMSEPPIQSEGGTGPGTDMTPGPGPRRSIYVTTDQAALHYPGLGGAGDTRLALFYAPNNDCSVLQEVACADNIANDGTNLAPYAPLRYDRPIPGRYYLLVSTVYNVDRGNTYLTVSDPPAQPTASIPTFSTWGRVILTLVLIASGATFLLRRRRVAM